MCWQRLHTDLLLISVVVGGCGFVRTTVFAVVVEAVVAASVVEGCFAKIVAEFETDSCRFAAAAAAVAVVVVVAAVAAAAVAV